MYKEYGGMNFYQGITKELPRYMFQMCTTVCLCVAVLCALIEKYFANKGLLLNKPWVVSTIYMYNPEENNVLHSVLFGIFHSEVHTVVCPSPWNPQFRYS